MDLQIAGRWALVSGASRGLGLGCAQALAHEGVHVLLVAREPVTLERACAQLRAECEARAGAGAPSAQVIGVSADITTEAGRQAVWSAPGGPGQRFDIVVTNAGGPPPGDFRQWSQSDWQQALNANMLTPIELIKATIDGMAERSFGRIVNITSGAVKAPIDVLGLSNGARSGLTGFVAGLARSPVAARGVTINNLLPGKFDTDRLRAMQAAAAQKQGIDIEQFRAVQQQHIPAARFGTAEEFGALCAFVCSAQAAYLNGQNILVDGGAYPGTL